MVIKYNKDELSGIRLALAVTRSTIRSNLLQISQQARDDNEAILLSSPKIYLERIRYKDQVYVDSDGAQQTKRVPYRQVVRDYRASARVCKSTLSEIATDADTIRNDVLNKIDQVNDALIDIMNLINDFEGQEGLNIGNEMGGDEYDFNFLAQYGPMPSETTAEAELGTAEESYAPNSLGMLAGENIGLLGLQALRNIVQVSNEGIDESEKLNEIDVYLTNLSGSYNQMDDEEKRKVSEELLLKIEELDVDSLSPEEQYETYRALFGGELMTSEELEGFIPTFDNLPEDAQNQLRDANGNIIDSIEDLTFDDGLKAEVEATRPTGGKTNKPQDLSFGDHPTAGEFTRYEELGLNLDTDGDGVIDTNIDRNGDGIVDIDIDMNNDGISDGDFNDDMINELIAAKNNDYDDHYYELLAQVGENGSTQATDVIDRMLENPTLSPERRAELEALRTEIATSSTEAVEGLRAEGGEAAERFGMFNHEMLGSGLNDTGKPSFEVSFTEESMNPDKEAMTGIPGQTDMSPEESPAIPEDAINTSDAGKDPALDSGKDQADTGAGSSAGTQGGQAAGGHGTQGGQAAGGHGTQGGQTSGGQGTQGGNGGGSTVTSKFKELRQEVAQGVQHARENVRQSVQEIRQEVREIREEVRQDVQEFRQEVREDVQDVREYAREQLEGLSGGHDNPSLGADNSSRDIELNPDITATDTSSDAPAVEVSKPSDIGDIEVEVDKKMEVKSAGIIASAAGLGVVTNAAGGGSVPTPPPSLPQLSPTAGDSLGINTAYSTNAPVTSGGTGSANSSVISGAGSTTNSNNAVADNSSLSKPNTNKPSSTIGGKNNNTPSNTPGKGDGNANNKVDGDSFGNSNKIEENKSEEEVVMLGDASVAEQNAKDEKEIKIATGVTLAGMLGTLAFKLLNVITLLSFILVIIALALLYSTFRVKKHRDKKKREKLLELRKEEKNKKEGAKVVTDVENIVDESTPKTLEEVADASAAVETNGVEEKVEEVKKEENEFSEQPFEPSKNKKDEAVTDAQE